MRQAAQKTISGGVTHTRRGMTLIELVIVMGLVALVLGIGLGSIASLDLGSHATKGLVQSGLRAANNWAIARRSPARVRIDVAAGEMVAEGQDVIGTWHFETKPPKGAFQLDGTLSGARLVEDGFLGRAVSFHGLPPGARFEVPVDRTSAFDLRAGFVVQLALRPEKADRGTVLRIGNAVKLEVTRGLGLNASFAAWREDETGREVSAGDASIKTDEGVLRLDRWNRVLVSYDRRALVIEVEGIRVAELPEVANVGPVKTPMVLGGGERPWSGSVDNLVISAVSVEETIVLPKNTSFASDSPKQIVFASGGGLDRSVHSEPVMIELEHVDGGRSTVQVNIYGTVE